VPRESPLAKAVQSQRPHGGRLRRRRRKRKKAVVL
jgi:hypothetical protein